MSQEQDFNALPPETRLLILEANAFRAVEARDTAVAQLQQLHAAINELRKNAPAPEAPAPEEPAPEAPAVEGEADVINS